MQSKRRIVALVVTGLVGASLAFGGAVFAVTSSGQANGDCKMSFSTSDVQIQGGYSPVAEATMTKTCLGPVEGRFTAELRRLTPGNSSSFMYMIATCIGTGGQTNPCTVGQLSYAFPVGTFLSDCRVGGTETCPSETLGTRGMNLVWTSLNRGIWKFEVIASQIGEATVDRTFTVEAFSA